MNRDSLFVISDILDGLFDS